MENTEEKGLKTLEDGFFSKMFGFIKNIFSKKNNIVNVTYKEVEPVKEEKREPEIQKNNMDLTQEIDVDAVILEVLQQDYEDGKIKEEDLTDEQYESLKQLYESQIDKLNASIAKSKEKILAIKNKSGNKV